MSRSATLQSVPRWVYREQGSPTCAVVRHAERADSDRWDCRDTALKFQLQNFPRDPPLSVFGREQAVEIGGELLDVAHHALATSKHGDGEDLSDRAFGIVVSSPYLRCIQTAAHICRALKLPLLLDRALGEVYGPEVMGDDEPDCVLHSLEEGARYCRVLGVELRSKIVGRWPVWPEAVGAARVRYVQRFLEYLRRSEVTRRNFILVTHGYGVAAMLGTMPAMEAQSVKSVDLGGYFIARAVPSSRERNSMCTEMASCDGITNLRVSDAQDAEEDQRYPCATHWQVTFSKVKIGRRTEESLMKRIKRWAGKSRYNELQIGQLLFLSKASKLPAVACHQNTWNSMDSEDSDTFSDTGASTIYFGESRECSPKNKCEQIGLSPRSLIPKSSRKFETREKCPSHNEHSDKTLKKVYCELGLSPVHSRQTTEKCKFLVFL